MGLIKHLTAPIRSLVRFPLFQLALVIVVILWLQGADEISTIGKIFAALDVLVDTTVRLFSALFTVKSFTKSWLISGFMIAYVYLACLLILSLMRVAIRLAVDLVGQSKDEADALCGSREFGRPASRSRNGKRDLPGPPTTNRPTLRSRTGYCAGRSAMWP